jgi:D-sedoheptulose 7-phosphate isomerase
MEDMTERDNKSLTLREYALEYLKEVREALDEVPLTDLERIVSVLEEAYRKRKQIFIVGNGGSASTASHFACDLGKGTASGEKPRFRVMSLNDNIPLMTAIGNDLGFEEVFIEQLRNLLEEGDVVILITGSGNSENLLRAAEYANSRGATTVGFIGFGGGKLKKIVKEHATFSSTKYEIVEPLHLVLEHLISFYFKAKIAEAS